MADPALYAPGRAADVTQAQRLAAITREADAAEMAAEEALEAAGQPARSRIRHTLLHPDP